MKMPEKMTATSQGYLAIISAGLIWGLAPIYYKLLVHVPPLEVVSHRTLWSFLTFAIVLLMQRRLGELMSVFKNFKTVLLVFAAGVTISVNWCVFILSIQIDRAVEASFGYYIFPLVSVTFGYFVFKERLNRGQGVAVLLAFTAVLVLGIGLGVTPWISLILAGSFGIYGVMKKLLDIGPIVSVTGEVLILLPVALLWMWGVNYAGWTGVSGREGGYFGNNITTSLLLIFAGFLTATPLILFSFAARRLPMASIGLFQYLNPSLQFLVAVLIFKETFTIWHGIAFAFIWTAVVVFVTATPRQAKS